jgi:hypothetical protein
MVILVTRRVIRTGSKEKFIGLNIPNTEIKKSID